VAKHGPDDPDRSFPTAMRAAGYRAKSMADQSTPREALLIHYWYILQKRKTVVLVFMAVLAITVTIGTLLSDKYYRASAILEIQPKAPVVFDVDEVAEMVSTRTAVEMRSYYGTQYRILQSRTVIGDAIERLREEHGVTDFDVVEKPVGMFRAGLRIEPDAETHLVEVVYEYTDPDKAALFANALAQAYIEQNLERSLSAAKQALEWLEDQQRIYRVRKTEADQKVHEYMWGESLLGMQEGRSRTQNALEKLQTAWSEDHTERVQVEATLTDLERLRNRGDITGLASYLSDEDPVLQRRMSRMRELEEERGKLEGRYLPDHPQMKQIESEIGQVRKAMEDGVDQVIRARRAKLELVSSREAALEADMEEVTRELEALEVKLIELEFLEADAKRNEEFYKSLDQRMSEVDLGAMIRANNVRVVDPAILTAEPVRPVLPVNVAMGLLMGLFGGCALAFFMEYLDSTVKSREDVEITVGMPFLGIVPLIEDQDLKTLTNTRDRSIFVHAVPRSNVAEALRSVRTNLLFSGHGPLNRLLITSALPQEGKSFLTSNLSVLIAATGSKLLIIDADLRRPNLHKLFELENSQGLSTVLAGIHRFEECVIQTHVPNLHVLLAGPTPPNPAELLGSERMTELLDSITGYDMILIDSPPVNVVADPLMLSSLVDGVLVIIEANATSRSLVARTRDLLIEVNANVLGAVVNKLNVRRAGYGYYYYDYGYYGEREGPPGPGGPRPPAPGPIDLETKAS
jgi:capsular exopolysaccharide synthesis family protein